MNREIPIYFDSVIVSSPIQEIAGNSSVGRLKVRAFTKYANRNGSYITDAVANQLIASATQGMTPVVGFFDPDSKTWASHTGPTLANGYGYVESFLGWQPFEDTDGVTRDYAVFSVILFTDYFEEAKNILGQNQSMELDPASIQGDWADIEGTEYFVYTTAKMLGFCVIGSHEPCFSVSAFFSKNDNEYKTQYEKFSSLLFDLKARVEEAEKGGEQLMNEFENQEQEVLENEVENPQTEELQNFEENKEEVQEEEDVKEEEVKEEEEEPIVEEESVTEEEEQDDSYFKHKYTTLLKEHMEVMSKHHNTLLKVEELKNQLQTKIQEYEALEAKNNELQTSISQYEAAAAAIEEDRKTALVEKYEKNISNEEEINKIKGSIKDFSYDELESKLAILYANQQMAGSEEEEKVPLPEPTKSQFALLMEKYRKN